MLVYRRVYAATSIHLTFSVTTPSVPFIWKRVSKSWNHITFTQTSLGVLIGDQLPSWELLYSLPRHFWRLLSFSQGRIWFILWRACIDVFFFRVVIIESYSSPCVGPITMVDTIIQSISLIQILKLKSSIFRSLLLSCEIISCFQIIWRI